MSIYNIPVLIQSYFFIHMLCFVLPSVWSQGAQVVSCSGVMNNILL